MLDFNTVYKITARGADGNSYPYICVGVKHTEIIRKNENVTNIKYLVNSEAFVGKQIYARKIWQLEDGVVEAEIQHDEPIVYRFEPLTVKRWAKMSSDITGYETLSAQITTDSKLQNFYRDLYLKDWWKEAG